MILREKSHLNKEARKYVHKNWNPKYYTSDAAHDHIDIYHHRNL